MEDVRMSQLQQDFVRRTHLARPMPLLKYSGIMLYQKLSRNLVNL